MKLILHTDGGSRGNPGPSAAGAVLSDVRGKTIDVVKKFLGQATNNEAEYAALIFGLEKAHVLGATEIQIFLDSQLVVEQVCGRWKVKEPRLKNAVAKVHALLLHFPKWQIAHIPREKNRVADRLVNEVLDSLVSG